MLANDKHSLIFQNPNYYFKSILNLINFEIWPINSRPKFKNYNNEKHSSLSHRSICYCEQTGFITLTTARASAPIYKLVWRELFIYVLLYCSLSLVYRLALDNEGKTTLYSVTRSYWCEALSLLSTWLVG